MNSPAAHDHSTGSRAAETTKAHGTTLLPGGRHFFIRRVHSLAGILFGGYIAVHLMVNATGLWPRIYQLNVDHIHRLEPALPLIEIVTIFTPLLIHLLYGLYVAWFGVKYNTFQYNYGGNLRYTLQRWTAVILVLFVAFHIATLHKWGLIGLYRILVKFDMPHIQWMLSYGGLFEAHNKAFQTTVSGIRYFWDYKDATHSINIMVMALYLLGVWSAVFHFANGLWTAAIVWGLTVTANAQKRWGHVCLALGVVLFVVGTTAWVAFTIAPAARNSNSAEIDAATHTLPDEVVPTP